MSRNKKSVAFQVDEQTESSNVNNINDLRHPDQPSSPSGLHKNMSECCYSIANLALIIACVVAITFLIQFIQDEPLYEYGEHLLSLRFYRQLIYLLVIVPLVLLIPLFNATSAFCMSANKQQRHQQHHQLARSILSGKILYQFIMLILVFIGLVFVAPNIRTSSVASQVELELRKHMRWRYENSFSYDFMDRLQEEYECCDELWYRSNMNDHLPTSCFVRDSNFALIHDETCSEAIGGLVSTRCAIIGACLIVALVSLACLAAIDIIDLLTMSASDTYDIRANQPKLIGANSAGADEDSSGSHRSSLNSLSSGRREQQQQQQQQQQHQQQQQQQQTFVKTPQINCANYLDANKRALAGQPVVHLVDDQLPPVTSSASSSSSLNRLKSSERQRDLPLLIGHHDDDDDDDDGDGDEHEHQDRRRPSSRASSVASGRLPPLPPAPPTILTRASYNQIERDRSQSPVFLGSTLERQTETKKTTTTSTTTTAASKPIKSALKKSPSSQRLESTSSTSSNSLNLDQTDARFSDRRQPPAEGHQEEDADSLLDYAERLRTNSASLLRRQQEQQREIQLQQTKRSLLNVRFADDQ